MSESLAAYYDSDDDISCGPITLREVKRNLRNNIGGRKLTRRVTVGYKSPPNIQEFGKDENEVEDIKDLIEDVRKLSSNSKCFTSPETLSSNSKCFTSPETLSSMLAVDDNMATSDSLYKKKEHQVLEKSNCVEVPTIHDSIINLSDDFLPAFEIKEETVAITNKNSKDDIIEISDEDDSLIEIVEEIKYNIDNESFGFEDDVIIDYKENPNKVLNIDSFGFEEDICYNEETNNLDCPKVNETSHEMLRYQGVQSKYENISGICNLENSLNNSMSEIFGEEDSQSKNDMSAIFPEENSQSNNDMSAIFPEENSQSNMSEIFPEKNSQPKDHMSEIFPEENSQSKNDMSEIFPEEKFPGRNTSEICPEEKSLTASDNEHFNDTLEEIENLLAKGLNYSMKCDSTDKTQISPIFAEPTPNSFKSKIPLRPQNLKKMYENVVNPIVTNMKTPSPFKVPMNPKRFSPIQQNILRPHKNDYKDIISPVGMYIKHSSTAPMYQKVQNFNFQKPNSYSTSPKKPISKENIQLPTAIYRPAKQIQKYTEENNYNLPTSVKKLFTTKMQTIKHEMKIVESLDAGVKEKQLQDGDLTVNYSSNSNAVDISILKWKENIM